MAAARAGRREQAGAPRAEHEQPHESPPYNGPVTSILGERVAELKADREHGASWMARRAVEALAEVAKEPAASGEELLERLVTAGRELAESRPGVGAIAGAVGRLLAAAAANVQLEVADLQQLVGEEAKSLVNGRERAGASIAIQLRERLEDAVVLTHSASATVREALLHTPPARVICTVSSPQDEGRAFAEELRSNGLEVELVEDDEAPGPARVGLAAAARRRHGLPRRHALQQDGHERAGRGGGGEQRSGDRRLRGDQAGPDRRGRRAGADRREFELTPPALVDSVVTEEGTVSPDGIGALVDRTPFLREGYALLRKGY